MYLNGEEVQPPAHMEDDPNEDPTICTDIVAGVGSSVILGQEPVVVNKKIVYTPPPRGSQP